MPKSNLSPDPSRGRESVRPATAGLPRIPAASDPFRLLFEANPAPICVVETISSAILEANAAFATLAGRPRETLIGVALSDLHPSAAALPETATTWTFVTPSGEPTTAEIAATDVEFEGRPARLLVVTGLPGRSPTEYALLEERERLSVALESAGMTTWDWDMQSGQMHYRRPGKTDISAPTSGGWDGQGTFLDALPEDRPTVRAAVEAALAGDGNYHAEFRNRDRTGAIRWASVDGRVTRDSNGKPIRMVGVAADITERKRADDLVRESEARFRAFVEAAPSAIWIYDGSDTLFVNDALLAMTGYTREQLTAPGEFDRLFDPEDNRTMGRRAQARLRGEDVDPNYEVRITRADGQQRWLGVSAATIALEGRPAVLVNAFDITDRKDVEAALRESESRFRAVVDNSPDFITRIDSNLKHVFVNATAERDAGLVPGKILGKRADQLGYPPEIGALWVARHQQVIDSGEPIEFEYQLNEGQTTAWRRCRLIPEFGASGAVEHVLSVVTDLTAEKRAEEERRRLDLQVQNAQKLESLGILAGGIAHDFNNLLVAMLGNAGLALVELPPESPARQTVQAIEIAAQRAADLTRQMLAYSGKGRFVIEMLNLSRVVEEMSHLLEVSISKRARLEYHFAPGLPQVEADATQIRQVIMNLITNASDAVSEQGGVISLSTGVIHADAAYLASTYIDSDLPEGDYVFVEVADTGEGMDEDTRQRIFDPFFTTKFTGRGLGLAAVLGIVRGHKGAIKLESERGRGTTFTVLLPAAQKPANVTLGAPETMSERATSHSATVLIADDDETVRNVTRRILEHSGYSVILAADGREAVELYRATPGGIDIVLLDMTMPHMDGEETFRELRLLNPAVRVLLTSGYNEQDATERFAGKGLLGFIQKPYRPNELVDRIEAALAAD